MQRRKLKTERKEEQVRVRMTGGQKSMLTAAAEHAGLDVSTWLRSLGLQEAERLRREK